MRILIQERNPEEFIRLLSGLQDARHAKYGSSVKLLEPNLKNSAGGLRDLHTVLWLLYGTGYCDIPDHIDKTTAISTLPFSRKLRRLCSTQNCRTRDRDTHPE